MMNIIFDGVEYTDVAEGYSELSLGKFMEVSDINQDDYKSPTDWTVHLIATLIGCPTDSLYELPFMDLQTLLEHFRWITKLPEKKTNKEIFIDDVKYVVKPNTQMTTGEWISVEAFLTDELKNDKNFHLVLAIMLRPEIDGKIKPLEDNFEDILERANLFKKKMMIEECYGLIQDFSSGARKSTLKITKASSTLKELKKVN
jgi:hypothetical protein